MSVPANRSKLLTQEEQEEYCHFLIQGCGLRMAAIALGRPYPHIVYTRLYLPMFDQRIVDAGELVNERVELALFRKCAVDGDIKAIRFWLCNRSSGRWQPEARTLNVVAQDLSEDHQLSALADARSILESGDEDLIEAACDVFLKAQSHSRVHNGEESGSNRQNGNGSKGRA